MTVLSEKPWHTPPPEKEILGGLPAPPGMLSPEETYMLYLLGRDVFRGHGSIADCGTYCGRSTTCLGRGALANPNLSAPPRIYAYDRFVVDDDYLVNSLKAQFGVEAKLGDSFEGIFRRVIEPVGHIVEVRPGDFNHSKPPDEPIEILHVDVAKTKELNGRIISHYVTKLIPGVSLVAHQDYYWPYLPFIPVTMEYLQRYFEDVDESIAGTRLFRFRESIPRSRLQRAMNYDFGVGECLLLLEQAQDRITSAGPKAILDLTSFIVRNSAEQWGPRDRERHFREVVERSVGVDHAYYQYTRRVLAEGIRCAHVLDSVAAHRRSSPSSSEPQSPTPPAISISGSEAAIPKTEPNLLGSIHAALDELYPPIPDLNPVPLGYVFAIPRGGSTLLDEIMVLLCRAARVRFVAVDGILKQLGIPRDQAPKELGTIFRSVGHIYGGMRQLPTTYDLPQLATAKKVLLTRDLRDVLVSNYFYNRTSIQLGYVDASFTDEGRKRVEQATAHARSTSIDDYVTALLAHHRKEICDPYIALVRSGFVNVLRYEDVIFDQAGWARSLSSYFDLGVSESVCASIASSRTALPTREDPNAHVRKRVPGDHREKLKPETIRRINTELREYLELFGYINN